MLVGRVAEQRPRPLVLVHGRRHAADPELPGRPASCSRPPARDRTSPTAAGPVRRGSGVTSATRRRGTRDVAGPRPERRQLLRGGRGPGTTMNVQRCRFLLLPERRPAWRIRSRWSALSGRSAKRRIARFRATADQTGDGSRARSRRRGGGGGTGGEAAGSRASASGRRGSRRAARPGRGSADRRTAPPSRRTGPRPAGSARQVRPPRPRQPSRDPAGRRARSSRKRATARR